MPKPSIALFALEALPNARAVRRFVADHAAEIAFVGLSNAERPSTGGLVGQVRRHLARSGPAFLPYLAVNFGLPDLLRPVAPLTQRIAGTTGSPEATPLATLCRRHGIPTLTVDDVNGADVADLLRRHEPDLIVTFHFDQILAGETIARARLGGLNVHPGLLPRHRGPVPTIHALAEGPDAFGVTVHRLAVAIDAGAILEQAPVALPADVTATRAAVLLHEHGRNLLDAVLADIARDGAVPEGRTVPVLPYCPFPDAGFLKAMRRRGRYLTDVGDLREALSLSARGA
ncbi:formyl transferase [Methylobacterium sp. WL30]|uniref:formyltransferase family protein n=1 Tax=unclassified Methylobacterium TaxID=2615210 RepID=UPI0011CC44A0|nr:MULTISPECIES: formyltransferase family protein [unclassified Methylobacterium]TXN25297.1 formyl transferase [Methylobacterium sp. WL93]TXN50443.1 formyl transferase [Methylobacterium sp. WL119]TXN65866.1 formyl transferase [Methylobacterium sp. WL30]